MMELALVMPVFVLLLMGGCWLLVGLVDTSSASWAAQRAAEASVQQGGTTASAQAAASTYLGRTILSSVPADVSCSPPVTPQQHLYICVTEVPATATSFRQETVAIRGWVNLGLPFNGGYVAISAVDTELSRGAACTSC